MIFDDLRERLNARITPWLTNQGVETIPSYTIEEPPAGIDADAACNLAMVLAKPLRKAPRQIAQELQTILAVEKDLVAETTIAGAGFLNIRWAPERLGHELRSIIEQSDRFGRSASSIGEKVLIEFVSANPTGPLHVGHGRGAALGDSLALIFAHVGYAVTREYYINDAGNQVQLLGESVVARALELQGKPFTMPSEGYHGDYIKDTAREFVQAHPNEAGNVDVAKQFALEKMQKAIETDLADFGVRFDSWFSEASVVRKGLVEKYVEALRQRGHVEDSDGAIWFVSPEEKEEERDKNRVLKKRDGKWTYFATDIAYHADKYDRGFARLIDVWGADHHGYVPRVKGSMQALGYDPTKLHVVLNQLVSLTRDGVPVSMSKRSGDFITLREVLEEVGRDACRFFFAMRGPNTAFDFDLELAKKHTNDNPVYYLQYAHARICSIFRQTEEKTGKAYNRKAADVSRLIEKEERELIKRMALFPQILTVCIQEDSPHPLATYLLSLCRQFHHFYDHHRVLGDDPALTQARLFLLDGVRLVLRLGLKLLGVSAPEQM